MPTVYARTLSEIIEGAQRLCNDYVRPGSDGRKWRWIEVKNAVDDVLLDLVNDTWVLKDIRVVPLQEGVNIYTLPADCLRLLRVGIHGAEGHAMIPQSMTQVDLTGGARLATGDPETFFRDFLRANQIGVLPIPYRDGSTFTKDSDYGALRQISDGDGNLLPYEDNEPLRSVRGARFHRSGTGGIVRSVISPYGNLQVHFVRVPKRMELVDDYPDPDLPEFIHKDIKYGVAAKLLRYRKDKLARAKLIRFSRKWLDATLNLRTRCDYTGPMGYSMEPL